MLSDNKAAIDAAKNELDQAHAEHVAKAAKATETQAALDAAILAYQAAEADATRQVLADKAEKLAEALHAYAAELPHPTVPNVPPPVTPAAN